MMSLHLWFAFVLASTALLVVPGPTVMVVASYAIGRGKSSGWATVPGVALGDLTAMTASLVGAGAILATSATLFTILKLAGAAYLIWLGIGLWRSQGHLGSLPGVKEKSPMRMFWNAYIVTAFNPKGIVFFIAFVPQFVDPAGSVFAQFALLEATFVVLATINIIAWVLLAGSFSERFKRQGSLRLANRIGGGFLIGAGLLTATVRRVG